MRRVSIRRVMAFVLVSAIGLAALKNASDLWAGMMLLLAFAVIGTALMAAVILRGQERRWWAGFAFFGGGYLALAFAPWLSDTFRRQLGTTFIQRGESSASFPPVGSLYQKDLVGADPRARDDAGKLKRIASVLYSWAIARGHALLAETIWGAMDDAFDLDH